MGLGDACYPTSFLCSRRCTTNGAQRPRIPRWQGHEAGSLREHREQKYSLSTPSASVGGGGGGVGICEILSLPIPYVIHHFRKMISLRSQCLIKAQVLCTFSRTAPVSKRGDRSARTFLGFLLSSFVLLTGFSLHLSCSLPTWHAIFALALMILERSDHPGDRHTRLKLLALLIRGWISVWGLCVPRSHSCCSL